MPHVKAEMLQKARPYWVTFVLVWVTKLLKLHMLLLSTSATDKARYQDAWTFAHVSVAAVLSFQGHL